MNAVWRWSLPIFLLVLLLLLQVQLWVGPESIQQRFELHALVKKQQEKNANLKARNLVLAAEIEALRYSQQTAEANAREELGLVAPGETFYHVVDAPS